MATPRIFWQTPLAAHQTVALPESIHHHIVRVLRLKPGDAVCLFDGRGQEFEAVVVVAEKRESAVRIAQCNHINRESPLDLTLFQGISRGDRMDYTLQKGVELGVNRIVPVVTRRSHPLGDRSRADKKLAHWQAVIISAMEQSGRTRAVELLPIQPLGDCIAGATPASRLILDPGARQTLASLPKPAAIHFLVGPESGFAPDELDTAYAAGYTGITLGPRILRTETAALAAISAMQTLWGDFT